MRARLNRGDDDLRPRRRSGALAFIALCLSAAVLGPLVAIAAAGSPGPSDSGGGGLITTSSNGATLTVGTTTLVATSPTPATTTVAATTTAATPPATSSCTEPLLGTSTAPVTTTPGTTITTASATTTTPAPGGGAPITGPVTTTATATTATTTSTATTSCVVAAPTTISTDAASAFTKRGMWIWELPATDGGNVAALIAQAQSYGIGTLFIKSGDGNAFWSQFSPTLVRELHAAGLQVCAWQYVYGTHPVAEADVGLQAVRDGADCLVIDAETQYQGRYAQAQKYMGTLRARLGSNYPIALAGFPYVDYHPTFPYSVFLGRNGAQYNLPQMYWQDIGTSVDSVYAHTFAFNELYQRPIYPLGQLYDSPSTSSVKRFRSVGLAYRAGGVSWWDWQSAHPRQFSAISAPAGPIRGYVADTTVASLSRGAVGDLVVLAQEHLWNTRERVRIDGGFGADTQRAVRAFQADNGLPVTGVVTPQTWNRLLKVPVPDVSWVTRGRAVVARVSA